MRDRYRLIPFPYIAYKTFVIAALAACFVATAVAGTGCKRAPKVRFREPCPIRTRPAGWADDVGKVHPHRDYEVIDRKNDWYRIEVFENNVWGWTRCPLAE